MAVKLQTGNTGMPVTSASDGILYSNIVGTGSYVMDVGSRLSATMADANTLIVNDGSVMHNGRHILMEGATRYTIPSGTQGKLRAHIAVIRVTVDENGVESADPVVISGEPVDSGTPPDPEWHGESMLDDATTSDMPLYRVVTDGINAGDPVRLFGYHDGSLHEMDMGNAATGVLDPARGGTGQESIQATRSAMGLGNTLGALPAANGGTGRTDGKAANVTGVVAVANGGSGLTASPSLLVNLAATAAANVMQASPRPGVTGTLPVANGGTGATTNAAIGLKAYPVGAVYISYVSTSPASLFGGTWTAITGRFPYFNAGTATGGSNTHSHWQTVGLDWVGAGNLYSTMGTTVTASRTVTAAEVGLNQLSNYTTNDITRQDATYEASSYPPYQTLYAWRRTA